MSFDGEYEASKWDWVAEQVEVYERTNGAEGNTLRDTGMPIIVMTTVGHKSGKVRKVPLMRVEHEGEYAIIASKGGRPENPGWYHNLVANPVVLVQDGPEPFETELRLVDGDERAAWWERAVAAFPPYADYEVTATEANRVIPVFISKVV
ncbi:MAG: deazaflavin-dependent oxidoreductase (nitroreductase family) [Acidimicrobiales bacterium]|jgi:F420H(2)-dependent quinone reductase